MAEDKAKIKKKTKELNENIYALNLDFDEDANAAKIASATNIITTESESNETEDDEEKELVILKGYDDLELEEDDDSIIEEPKKKKVLAKIEEGIKSSKRGRGRPRKTPEEKAIAAAQRAEARNGKNAGIAITRTNKKGAIEKQKSIKMHTENNLTEVKLGQNEYKIEMQKNEYNIYTEINETSYIIVREPCLRMVAGGLYIFMERQGEEYAITTNQDFKINYVIDNLERKNNVVNFKLTNLTQIEANSEGLIFEIDEEKVVENNLDDNKTLVISEEDGKVYLPYTKDEVKEDMVQNKGKKISELIEQNYILPLDKFKNSMRARFREGYNLMYKKEGKSRKSAFMLGLELMFETNLHPAIISACKNLEELDIYLDCLEDNELEKFSCFKIIYKSLPTLTKKGKLQEF